jgi:predicted transcriptional regulator
LRSVANRTQMKCMQMLRIARLILGVPIARLSKVARVSAREIDRIERGAVAPQRATLERLDEALVTILRERKLEAQRDAA